MAAPVDVLGPILEMMTWVGFVPGVPLLIAAWIIAKRRCQWDSVEATTFSAGGFTGLRWNRPDGSERQVLLEAVLPADGRNPVQVHYDTCHPARWSLTPPRPDRTVLLLGLVLTAVGLLSTIGGFVLLFF
ncbi:MULTISPECIES: hypothetical protein [Paenarthrobacter]|uniref:hypothetical protein n=1 Tax=Paenarthrobacter TaxID=1742992 RepID=UPI00074D3969|nr:hypothetical protein [Paenarthrobacter ureafaciens]AMB41972.1 hypothetical protein AUT26_18455 [Arthrobacter sp. ATCC 21022]KUR62780.1 hypothetical protein JM67_20510 [Arthrobacter sp. ATCC 21022]RWW94662.1 hypothetical protein AUR_08640 [Paenarthrobacter ureafaciens]